MPKTARTTQDSFDRIHAGILSEIPEARRLWDETAAKRKIALLLTRLRTDSGLSQKDVGARAGWDKAFVSRLEGALGGIPDTQTIARYAAACGATLGLVVGKSSGASQVHVVDAVTLHGGPDSAAFEALRERDLELSSNVE
jgi:transcriptional regulator with XRE-family HTH domain